MAALKDRVALITGAGSGIGRAIALRFAREGAIVGVVDISAKRAQAVVEELDGRGFAASCDVTKSEEFDTLITDCVTQHGGLDILVNNVGFTLPGRIEAVDDTTWQTLLQGNLSSTFFGTRAALRIMSRQGRGAIINISSGAGLFGAPGLGPYAACKAGVINLTQTAAVEHAGSGVRVNCIVPGAIATEAMIGWAEQLPGGRAAYEQKLTPKRLGLPEEIANAVLFLASDEASYVNGTALVVDGGASARMPSSAE